MSEPDRYRGARLGAPVSPRSRVREALFGGAGGGSARADVGLLALRLFAGLAISLAHGLGKMPPSDRFLSGVESMGFPLPGLFGWAAGLSEFAGGILIALGLLTRPAAFFALCTMLVAVTLRHAGDPFGDRELPLLFASVFLFLVLAGAGRFSLDAAIRGRGDRI